jgi:hypothetical protein
MRHRLSFSLLGFLDVPATVDPQPRLGNVAQRRESFENKGLSWDRM